MKEVDATDKYYLHGVSVCYMEYGSVCISESCQVIENNLDCIFNKVFAIGCFHPSLLFSLILFPLFPLLPLPPISFSPLPPFLSLFLPPLPSSFLSSPSLPS